MRHIHFVTFATPAFLVRQWLLNRTARWFGEVDTLHVWTKARLARNGFIQRHAELFPGSTGFGWYAWKPYIILQALLAAKDGDIVIYQDVGRRDPVLISRSLRKWAVFLTDHGFPCIAGVQIPAWGANRLWTKRAVFAAMDLHGSRYEDEPQIQASWSVWQKCPRAEVLVREWAELCEHLDLVGGQLENGMDNEVVGFKEHRWDQSLLTLLALRESLPVLNPNQRRTIGLNEKSIDSFSDIARPSAGFKLFNLLFGMYAVVERVIKKIAGTCRRRYSAQ